MYLAFLFRPSIDFVKPLSGYDYFSQTVTHCYSLVYYNTGAGTTPYRSTITSTLTSSPVCEPVDTMSNPSFLPPRKYSLFLSEKVLRVKNRSCDLEISISNPAGRPGLFVKVSLVKRFHPFPNKPWFLFYVSAVQVFKKHCGKRRNCT